MSTPRTPHRVTFWVTLVVSAVLVVVGFAALSLVNAKQGEIRSELSSQKIFFPAKGSEPLAKLENPADRAAMEQYAGQQMTTGPQAKVYAEHFIHAHMMAATGGLSYAEVGNALKADPKNEDLIKAKASALNGNMLIGSLKGTDAWWTVTGYGITAATVLVVVGFGLFGLTLVVAVVRRRV